MAIARDAFFVLGLCSICFGVWQIYRPAAYIVAGAIACALAYLLAPAPQSIEDNAESTE